MAILLLHTEFLRACRTIEVLSCSSEHGIPTLMFIYNYEGQSYRIFNNLSELLSFFEEGLEPQWHFETEEEVDAWMGRIY